VWESRTPPGFFKALLRWYEEGLFFSLRNENPPFELTSICKTNSMEYSLFLAKIRNAPHFASASNLLIYYFIKKFLSS